MQVEILEIGATELIRDLPKELAELKSIRQSNLILKITVIVLVVAVIGGVIYYRVKICNQIKTNQV